MCRVIDHSVSCVQFLASRRQHTMSHVTEDTDVLITQLRKSKSSESGESETAKDNQSDCKVRSRDERGDESTPPRTHVSPCTDARTVTQSHRPQVLLSSNKRSSATPVVSGEWRAERSEMVTGRRLGSREAIVRPHPGICRRLHRTAQ